MSCGDAPGTYKGYRRHLKAKSEVCDPCVRARADYDRARRYNMTAAEYDTMEEDQGGRCLICGSTPEVLHTDHSHATMEVRGLLCQYCNTMLGLALDSPEILQRGMQYLTLGLNAPPKEFLGDLTRKVTK